MIHKLNLAKYYPLFTITSAKTQTQQETRQDKTQFKAKQSKARVRLEIKLRLSAVQFSFLPDLIVSKSRLRRFLLLLPFSVGSVWLWFRVGLICSNTYQRLAIASAFVLAFASVPVTPLPVVLSLSLCLKAIPLQAPT
ncbi:hypothetical protein HZ326_5112 [Fusarium oxysporum f. sp. albedinis]|nr:hypothetical protein HZ326_5112 [Fusarium oxysporum f. sp. albedinis]